MMTSEPVFIDGVTFYAVTTEWKVFSPFSTIFVYLGDEKSRELILDKMLSVSDTHDSSTCHNALNFENDYCLVLIIFRLVPPLFKNVNFNLEFSENERTQAL